MRTTSFDFSPLFRSTIGFDGIPLLLDSATRASGHTDSYPPYNIEKTDENNYRVCELILDLATSYEKLVRKKKAA